MDWVDSSEKLHGIFNLGEPSTISLIEMVRTIEKALDLRAEFKMLPPQPGDVDKTFADISKSRTVHSYSPHTAFADGIAKSVERYKQGRQWQTW